jgi:hypothetical protein
MTARRTTAGWKRVAVPVCSAKIHHRRAAELRDALTTWETQGHATSLVTVTVPHDLGRPARQAAGRRAGRLEARHAVRRLAAAQAETRDRRAHHRPGVHLGRRERLAPAHPPRK